MSKKVGKSAKELLAEGKLLRIQISFTDEECELWDFLQAQPKMAKFVKGLIRQAMISENSGNNGYIPSIIYPTTPMIRQQQVYIKPHLVNADEYKNEEENEKNLRKLVGLL